MVCEFAIYRPINNALLKNYDLFLDFKPLTALGFKPAIKKFPDIFNCLNYLTMTGLARVLALFVIINVAG